MTPRSSADPDDEPGGASAVAPGEFGDEPGPDVVRAAGGVVVRDGAVLVVHRPRYGDWTLPKGKLDPGETWEGAARREVAEETGLRCSLDRPLAEIRYRDHKGRRKVVRYWVMTVIAGEPGFDDEFVPNDEVDEVRWLAPGDAAAILTYEHDRPLPERATGT